MRQKPEAICTVALIVINAAVFFILTLFGDTEDALFMLQHGAMYEPYIIDGHEYYRIFTCMFLHFGISHLLNNMVLLGALGWNLELEIGKIRFLIIYLGSGIAGISAGYHLQKQGDSVVIYERDNDWGGLCGNFTIDGFRFDKFVHFSFAPDDYTRNIFEESSPTFPHPPVSYNYWNGCWLKHPAQNNLHPLPVEEKVKIIEDFVNRPQKDVSQIENYEEWLRVQYGNYFAENFPFKYTRKYWGVEPEELETMS